MAESRYNYYIAGQCVHETSGKEKCISVPFSFKNKGMFKKLADMSFDDLGGRFNEWLQNNKFEGWVLDDTLEPDFEIYEDPCQGYIMIDALF